MLQTKAKINYSLTKIICTNKIYIRWISPDVLGQKLSAMELMITTVMLKLITAESVR